jgi:hypothetical protein
MANYGDGKYTFKYLIDCIEDDIIKEYLKYQQSKLYHSEEKDDEMFIEQWLYNNDADEIAHELHGFVAGRLFGKKKYIDHDIVMSDLILMSILTQIYIDMCKDNNWDLEDNSEWEDASNRYKDSLGFFKNSFKLIPIKQ